MKLFLTFCLSTLIFNNYSQCVLSVSGNYGGILTPFTVNFLGSNVPIDLNSKKWKNYADAKLLKNVKGDFSVFSINGLVGKTKVVSIDTSKDNGPDCGPIINLSEQFLESEELFALKSTWNVQPRPITVLSNENSTYEKVIKSILDQNPVLKNSKVVIKKIIKTDLDGDQKDEIFIHATNHPDLYNSGKGDYSMVIMRHLVNEKVVTVILNFQFQDHNCDSTEIPCWMPQYKISAILDLDGDGKMEVLISDEEHEGNGVTAYELTTEGLKVILFWGCGA